MGKVLPSFRKSIIDHIVEDIQSNTSHYYAYAANPVAYVGDVPTVTNDDYSTTFVNDWTMIFGKKLKYSDVIAMIDKNMWTSNTVYERYDQTSNTMYANANFYVISEPALVGGNYHIYKCIDNSNGVVSTINPSTIGTPTQPTTFTTSDGYKWRYVGSTTSANYSKFATNDYIPVYANTIISASAAENSGVDVVVIVNGGNNYAVYTNGTVKSVPNSSVIQIANTSSTDISFYNNSAIYIYNSLSTTGQVKVISNYIINASGKFIVTDSAVNTSVITPDVTNYYISPAVVFNSDGVTNPVGYTTINTTANSISSIVMLDAGTYISRCNVSIQTNPSYGSGANLYAIVPPAGGHGFDPVSELNVKGIGISFNFSNTEGSTIPTTNVVYNKIGLVKNPFGLNANNTKGSAFSSNTFNQVLIANTGTPYTFTLGDTVTGLTSNAKGIVVFSNTSQVYLVGDKNFANNEYLANSSGSTTTTINIDTIGDIYTKDLRPIYVQNINNITRSNSQTESYKLVIKI